MTRLLRFFGFALLSGVVFGALAALFSSVVAGLVVGLVVGSFVLGTAWLVEWRQRRPLRAGDRVVVEMGMQGEAKGVIEKIWGPPLRPTARVKLSGGAEVDIEVSQLTRARRWR